MAERDRRGWVQWFVGCPIPAKWHRSRGATCRLSWQPPDTFAPSAQQRQAIEIAHPQPFVRPYASRPHGMGSPRWSQRRPRSRKDFSRRRCRRRSNAPHPRWPHLDSPRWGTRPPSPQRLRYQSSRQPRRALAHRIFEEATACRGRPRFRGTICGPSSPRSRLLASDRGLCFRHRVPRSPAWRAERRPRCFETHQREVGRPSSRRS